MQAREPILQATRLKAGTDFFLAFSPGLGGHPQTIPCYDAIVISTDHDNVDWRAIAEHARLVVDTRNVCARNGWLGRNVVKA
jgi:UDP-N-acetyl-D-mannosaminuronate dehydrogenase